MTFGKADEATLSHWMADNARVSWIEQNDPLLPEAKLISQLNPPLNVDQNDHSALHNCLKEPRAQARQSAQESPVLV